jgi:hypothetical protein
MELEKYHSKYKDIEARKLYGEMLTQYLYDTQAALEYVAEYKPEVLHVYHGQDKGVIELETGEIVFAPVKPSKALIKAKPKTCIDTEKPLFWEVDAQRMNDEYTNAIKAKAISTSTPKRGAKPKIVQNKVKDSIEGYGSVTEWIESQPAVDNILFGATHLSTKTEWNEFDKPINTGLVFSVLKECDTINTTDTMALTGLSKSQAERINAVVRVVNTQYSNCRVI